MIVGNTTTTTTAMTTAAAITTTTQTEACVHEITGAGFDGGDDITDDQVLWVVGTTDQVKQATEGLDAGWGTSSIHLDNPDIDFHLPQDHDALRKRLAAFQRAVQAGAA